MYYDADGVLVFTDTDAASDGTGFLESAYTVADGLDTADPSFAYGQWTAVVITDGSQPPASLSAVNDSNSLSSDTFDVRSWSIPVFTDSSGTPVTSYDVPGGETTAYLTLTDLDQNTDATTIQTVTVTITDSETSDTITIILYETGVDTGIFANNSSA